MMCCLGMYDLHKIRARIDMTVEDCDADNDCNQAMVLSICICVRKIGVLCICVCGAEAWVGLGGRV